MSDIEGARRALEDAIGNAIDRRTDLAAVLRSTDALIEAVREDEREACAKACGEFSAWRCAKVIRARGGR